MKTFICVLSAVLLALAGITGTASAQTKPRINPPTSDMWRHGSTLSLFGGASGANSDFASMGGGALGWEITPRVAIEGSGSWYEWGHQTHAFAAALKTNVAVTTARPFVPFVAAGVGLYRASVAMGDSRMPEFYRARMPGFDGSLNASRIFMDPSVLVGGGVNLFVSRHYAIRPAVDATIVMRDGHTQTVTSAVVHVTYHFEDHPVTP
jgi:hypothetical protein